MSHKSTNRGICKNVDDVKTISFEDEKLLLQYKEI